MNCKNGRKRFSKYKEHLQVYNGRVSLFTYIVQWFYASLIGALEASCFFVSDYGTACILQTNFLMWATTSSVEANTQNNEISHWT